MQEGEGTKIQDYEEWLESVQQKQCIFDAPGASLNRMEFLKIDDAVARQHLQLLFRKRLESGVRSDIVRWTFERIQYCNNFGCAPPPALTALVGLLLEVKPARNSIRNWPKFNAAALFKAENPDASATAVKKAVGGSTKQIRDWLDHPMFDAAGQHQLMIKLHTKMAQQEIEGGT